MTAEDERSPVSSAPDVSAVLVNHDGLDHLRYSVPSLLETASDRFELIVVDNASRDGSVAWIRRRFPEVRVLALSRNTGWSAGNNVGASDALERGARRIAFVNADIRVDPRWIRSAESCFETDPSTGIVGFAIEGVGSPASLDAFDRARTAWIATVATPSENIQGCAFVVARSVMTTIGGFDERFFGYGSENDFTIRARRAGFLAVESNLPVWHFGEAAFGRMPLRAARMAMEAEIRLALKHEPIGTIARRVVVLAAVGCLPFVTIDRNHPPSRRRRPSSPLINGLLLAGALHNNLVELRERIARRTRNGEWEPIRAACASPRGTGSPSGETASSPYIDRLSGGGDGTRRCTRSDS